MYYHGADGMALVYDITSRASFDNIKGWLNETREAMHQASPAVMIGA
jgi:GTPase SAR1 family protein